MNPHKPSDSALAAEMSSAPELIGPAQADYLGPARVTGASTTHVLVRRQDGVEAPAEMALAFPYKPQVDDVLLVIAKEHAHYVIGVLQGRGHTALQFHGDVELRAVGGRLDLAADRGVGIHSGEIDIVGDKVKVVAEALTQKATSLLQRVRGLLSVQAGDSHAVVQGEWIAQSRRAEILTKETVAINGKEVHLG